MRITRMMMVLCVLLTISAATFAGVPKTVSYQGRLTNSGGTPVANGSYSVRFSLWSEATLGTESWSETQMVTVTDGLFSTELGSTSPFFGINCPGDCNEWLQIEVTIGGGVVTISPRSHLSATPWSLVSRSYYSEASNGAQKTKGVVKNVGDGTNPTQIVVLEGDADGDGHADYSLNDSVSTGSASRQIGHDLNDDGMPDVVIADQVSATGASHTVGDKPTSSQFGTLIESMVNIVEDRALLGLRSLNGLPPGSPVEDNILLETNGSSSKGVIRGGMSGSTTGTIRMQATPDSAVTVQESDSDGDGIAEARGIIIVKGSVGTSSKLQRLGGGILRGEAATEVDAIETRETLKTFFQTGDFPTQEQLVDASGSTFRAINTKGTGSNFRVILSATDSALSVLESDADGDGHAETKAAVSSVSSLGGGGGGGGASSAAYARMSADSNDDGIPDNTAEMIVTPTTSSMAINRKGTGADANRTISSTTYPDSAVQVVSSDEDGDGKRELEIEQVLKNLGLLTRTAVHRMVVDSDDDGNPDNSIEQSVTPTKSSLAIKTKGTGAQRFSAGGDCDDANASLHADFDADNDCVMESSISQVSDSGGTNHSMRVRLDSTPARISTNMTIGKQTQSASFGEKCDFDGDGVTDRSAEMVTDIDGAGIVMDYKGIQARIGAGKGWDGTIKGNMRLDNGPDMNVLFESDGDGYVSKRFGIGVLEPSNPLEHSSGAHLTIGGTWTNASDKNLKENFEKVDGLEILEKIEDLPVAEWNYKAEGDDIKHIGPTAQDFKEAFDLGDNDKSISTIDPSGVALVAIKELAKQNKDLKKKNADLEKKLDNLQKQVEKLASSMKQ